MSTSTWSPLIVTLRPADAGLRATRFADLVAQTGVSFSKDLLDLDVYQKMHTATQVEPQVYNPRRRPGRPARSIGL